jgi:flagellar basal-body rod modification protein FlgD
MQKSSSSSTSTDAASADQFLTLLTTQMKNQDPMNPMDNAQMTSQLAQINTVKGIGQLNTSIQSLLSAYNQSMSVEAASLIGKNVLTEGSKMALTSSGAVGGISLSGAADAVTVTIKNAAGTVVAQESLGTQDAGVTTFSWDGKDANGNALATGTYSFSVSASLAGQSVTASALQAGTVGALKQGSNGSFKLEVSGLSDDINYSDIKQVF